MHTCTPRIFKLLHVIKYFENVSEMFIVALKVPLEFSYGTLRYWYSYHDISKLQ